MKISTQLFIELERAMLKFIWNNQKPRIVKIKELLGESPFLTSSYITEQYSDRQVDQWNRVEESEMIPPAMVT